VVVGSWQGAPASVALGRSFTIVLRLTSSREARDVTVEVLSTPGVEVTSGDRTWTGSLVARNPRDLSFSVRIVANGEWTLGARITNKSKDDGDQVSGAVLSIAARDGVATLTADPAKAWAATTPEERKRLGIEAPQAPQPVRRPQPRQKPPQSR
jgi:hypothetical protein